MGEAGAVVRWAARFRLDDGTEQSAEGSEAVAGGDGLAEVERRLFARLGSDDGPVLLRCVVAPREPATEPAHLREPRRRLGVGVEELRAARRAGEPPSVILGRLRARFAAATPMAAMWAVHEAFDVPLEQLAEVAGWWAGALSGAALDAAVGPRVAEAEPCWNLPHTIRVAVRSGGEVGAVLRPALERHGSIRFVMLLREACGRRLGLRDAVDLIEHLRDGNERAVRATLAAAMPADDPDVDGERPGAG